MVVRLRFPAGRSVRREGTRFIDPIPLYGYLELDVHSHDLRELRWINKNTRNVEESLMITPGESTFQEVLEDDTGRTYVLDFKGTRVKYFYWLQRANIDDELRNLADLNGYLQFRGYLVTHMPITPRIAREPLDTRTPLVEAETAKLAVLWAREGVLNSTDPTDSLVNQLTNQDVIEYAAWQPDLIEPLKGLLPDDFRFPKKPTPENILPVLQSPQFRDAIEGLETVLQQRGLSPDLTHELGLRTKDGRSLRCFLRALNRLRPRTGTETTIECFAYIEDECHCDRCEPPAEFSGDEDNDDEIQFNDSEDGRSAH